MIEFVSGAAAGLLSGALLFVAAQRLRSRQAAEFANQLRWRMRWELEIVVKKVALATEVYDPSSWETRIDHLGGFHVLHAIRALIYDACWPDEDRYAVVTLTPLVRQLLETVQRVCQECMEAYSAAGFANQGPGFYGDLLLIVDRCRQGLRSYDNYRNWVERTARTAVPAELLDDWSSDYLWSAASEILIRLDHVLTVRRPPWARVTRLPTLTCRAVVNWAKSLRRGPTRGILLPRRDSSDVHRNATRRRG